MPKPYDLPLTVRATGSGDTLVIPDPGPGMQIILYRGSVHNRAASLSPLVSLRAGSNPLKWSARLSANGGNASFDFGNGWPLAPSQPLNVNLGAAGDVDVNITYFITIEA